MRRPDAAHWRAAEELELKAMSDRGVFGPRILVKDLSPEQRKKVVSTQWVYRLKNRDGALLYRARLVCRGDQQQEEVDSYAPNLNVKSLRVLCALAAQQDLILENMDFETAYLNAPTSSELYLRPAPGSLLPGEEPYVVPLQRALYGVRDSGKCWNDEITTSLTEFGLKQSHYDPCVFFMIVDTKPTMIFEIYTDDLISGHHASTETEYQQIKSAIKKRYATRDVDLRLNNFVGHRITQDLVAGTVTLDQDEYIQSVLAEFPSAKPVPVPCKDDAATKILPRDAPATDYPYRRVLGRTRYACNTRADIAFAQGFWERFSTAPGPEHVSGVQYMLNYLAAHPSAHLVYRKDRDVKFLRINAFSDSSWADCPATSCSTEGSLLRLGKGVIAFSSRKQRITKKPDPPEQTAFDPLDPTNEPAQSAHEAEYVSASNTCKEIVWLEELLTELQCIDPESTPSLAMDNRPAIQTAFARGVLKGSRHIRARFHKMRAMAQAGELILEWLPSDQNLSDIFTKPLSKLPFRRLRDLMLFMNDRDRPLQAASFALRLSHQLEQLRTTD